MNKKVLLLAGSLALAASAFALDFGGSLGNYTKLGTPAHPAEEQFKSINLKQEGIFTGWVRHNFNQNSFITAEADFRVRYQDGDLKDSADGKVHYIPDVKQFRFFNKFDTSRGPVSFNLGRFAFNDLTGLVISQPADGLSLSVDLRTVYFKTYAHYTGLLNAHNVTILPSKNGEPTGGENRYNPDYDTSYVFAPSFVNGGLQINFPYAIANQTVSTEVIYSKGIDGIEKGTKDFDRLYATLGLNGFLMRHLCYVITSTIETDFDKGVGNLTKATLTVLPGVKDSMINANFIYASGKQGELIPFTGFTSMTAVNAILEAEYSSLMKPGLSFSVKPVKTILISANADAVFDYKESSPEYNGTEFGLSGNFQVFTDLNFFAGVTEYLAKEKDMSKTTLIVTATLTF